ncbi:response regulator [Spirillospora sp. CA-255316]
MTTTHDEEHRILVAGDDRDTVERVLRLSGYAVETARDGLETLEAIDRARPDAAVMDATMPHLSGLGACRMLRSRGDDLPVLLLGSRDGLRERIDGLDAGADDHLAKPVELEELLARLRALLRRARRFAREPDAGEVLRFADLRLNADTRAPRRTAGPG